MGWRDARGVTPTPPAPLAAGTEGWRAARGAPTPLVQPGASFSTGPKPRVLGPGDYGFDPVDPANNVIAPGDEGPGRTSAPLPTRADTYDGSIGGIANYLFDTAALGAEGATSGAARLLGAPVDLINAAPMLLNLLPGEQGIGPITDRPIFGGDFMDDAAHSFGLLGGRPQPSDLLQKIVQRTGQEVGAAAVPVGFALKKGAELGAEGLAALRAAEPTKILGREMPSLAKMFVEPAAVDPARFVKKELGMAAGAGIGAGALGSAIDDPYADLGGAVLGAGATSIGGATIPRLLDLFAAATGNPKYVSRVVNEGVADALVRNSDIMGAQVDPNNLAKPLDTADLVEALMGPSKIEATIPGYTATTATRSGDFGLANLENARSRGDNAGLFRGITRGNDTAVNEAVGALAPTETPGAFRSALETQRAAVLRDAELAALAAGQNADSAIAPLTPRTTAPGRGNVIRTELEAAREVARGRTAEAYDAANISDVPVAPEGLRNTIQTYTDGLTQTERGLLPQGVVERVAALGRAPLDEAGNPLPLDPIRMKEAADLRSELGRLAAAAAADPRAERGGRNAARVLSGLSDQIDNFITANVTPDQRRALGVAREANIAEKDAFGRPGDPVAAALARRDGGTPAMRDENVARSFTNTQNLDTLLSRVDTPAIRTAIREEVLANADFSSVKNAARFAAEFGDRLDRFPGLRGEVTRAIDARRAAEDATSRFSEATKVFGENGRGDVAQYLKYGNVKARDAMSNVLADKDPVVTAGNLLDFVGNKPNAVEGARRAFWDVMEHKGKGTGLGAAGEDGVQPWIPTRWNAFLSNPVNARVAQELYRDDPEQWGRIVDISQVLRDAGAPRAASTALNPSGTAFMTKGSNPVSLAEAQSKLYQANTGRASYVYVLSHLAGRLASGLVSKQAEKAFGQLLDRALIDPTVAADLLKKNNPANRAALARSSKTWLAGHTEALFGDTNADDEVESIVMGDRK